MVSPRQGYLGFVTLHRGSSMLCLHRLPVFCSAFGTVICIHDNFFSRTCVNK